MRIAFYVTGVLFILALSAIAPGGATLPAGGQYSAVELNGVTYEIGKYSYDGFKMLLYCDGARLYTQAELREHVANQEPVILTRAVELAITQSRATDPLALIVVLRPQPAAPISRALRAVATPQLDEISRQMQAITRRALPTQSISPAEERAFVPRRLSDAELRDRRALAEQHDELQRQLRVATARQIATAVAPTQAELAAYVADLGGTVTARASLMNVLGVRLAAGQIQRLAGHPLVATIDLDQAGSPELDIQRQSLGLDAGFWAAGIDGGVYDVGVLDTGVQQDHPALSTHTFFSNCGTLDLDGHGTGIAGIMASTDLTYRGVAYGCDSIVVAKAGAEITSMTGLDYIASTGEPEVVNYSFGNGTASDVDYNAFDQFFDAAVNTLQFMVTKSAGNGGYDSSTTLTHPAPAYNLLVSADIDDFNSVTRADDRISPTSSIGPTLAGRKKPDLSAPGNNTMTASNTGGFADLSGTSAASAHTGGGIVLLCDLGTTDVLAGKAILLNTADAISDNNTATASDDYWARGSLWNRRYGWGYLNLAAAYLHGLDVFVDSLADHPDTAAFRLYVGQMHQFEKATLVWERHVAYAGNSYPTQIEMLSDLDLTAYGEADNLVISSSASHIDNVEQLDVSADAKVVLKVEAFGTLDPDVTTERFALAAQENFARANGPGFSLSFAHPACVAVNQSFSASVTVTNAGDVAAHNVLVTLAGATIVSGANPAPLGSIAPGQNAIAIWTVRAAASEGVFPLSAAVTSDSYAETFTGSGLSSYRVGGCQPGDMNCDGAVTFDDINPFVLALSDPQGYSLAFPNCLIQNGDCNADGKIDFDDINSFVAILSGGWN